MNRIARHQEVFFEASGPYAVPRDLAENISQAAFNVLGQYTGQFSAPRAKGVHIPIEGSPINIKHIGLGSADHTLLLTKRGLVPSDETRDASRISVDGRSIGWRDGTYVARSKTAVSIYNTMQCKILLMI